MTAMMSTLTTPQLRTTRCQLAVKVTSVCANSLWTPSCCASYHPCVGHRYYPENSLWTPWCCADYHRMSAINAEAQPQKRAYSSTKRKARCTTSSASERKMSSESIRKALQKRCNGSHNCIADFSEADVYAVRRWVPRGLWLVCGTSFTHSFHFDFSPTVCGQDPRHLTAHTLLPHLGIAFKFRAHSLFAALRIFTVFL